MVSILLDSLLEWLWGRQLPVSEESLRLWEIVGVSCWFSDEEPRLLGEAIPRSEEYASGICMRLDT